MIPKTVSCKIECKNSLEIPIIVHQTEADAIIINLPGFAGSIDGYNNKYETLANFMSDKKLGAVIRMENSVIPGREYSQTLVDFLGSVIEYAIENSKWICGKENAEIYLIGHSAGGEAVALIANKYPQVKKILLMAPAHMLQNAGDVFTELQKFNGDVFIVVGDKDDLGSIALYYYDKALNAQSIHFYDNPTRRIEFKEISSCDHHFTGEANGILLSHAPFWAFANQEWLFGDKCKLY